MSLILDALNRSRADSNPVPGLATYHPVEQVSVNRRQYLLWVALSVAVVIIAWLFLERYSAPRGPAVEIDVRAAGHATGPDAVSAPAGPSDIPERGAAGQQMPVESVQGAAIVVETADAAAVRQEAPAAQADTEVEMARAPDAVPDAATIGGTYADTPVSANDSLPVSEPSGGDAVAELYRNPPRDPAIPKPKPRQAAAPAAAGQGGADTSLDVDQMLRMAREEVRNAGLVDISVPFLSELSQQIKDGIPTIYYLRHDYSSDASRSTVVLNSKTLSVGDSAAAGMKVEEILPDSVVLNYQGTQFRLRALNSWINL